MMMKAALFFVMSSAGFSWSQTKTAIDSIETKHIGETIKIVLHEPKTNNITAS